MRGGSRDRSRLIPFHPVDPARHHRGITRRLIIRVAQMADEMRDIRWPSDGATLTSSVASRYKRDQSSSVAILSDLAVSVRRGNKVITQCDMTP